MIAAGIGAGCIIALLIVVFIAKTCSGSPTPQASATATQAQTNTPKTTPTASSTPTRTSPTTPASESPTPKPTTPTPKPTTPTATSTKSPTASHTPTPTIPSDKTATARQSASIFAGPGTNYAELTYISVGEQVQVLGRAATGDWYYVRNQAGVEGFADSKRLDWSGNFDSLPVKTPVTSPDNTRTPASGGNYPTLTMDLWMLDGMGRCEGSIWYQSIYIQGLGGNGVYTFYWNGEQRTACPSTGPCSFEISNVGGAVIRTARVVSGDGQVIERDLYIAPPACAP